MCLKDWRASCEMLRADSRRCKHGPVNKRGEVAMGVQEGRGGPGDKMQGEPPAKGAGGGRGESPSEGGALMGPRGKSIWKGQETPAKREKLQGRGGVRHSGEGLRKWT